MNDKIGNKEKIYQLLKKEPLTSIEIAEKLKISKDPEKNVQYIRMYILRLKNDGVIESNEKKGRCQVYTVVERNSENKPLNLLKELYAIMDNKMKPIKTLTDNEKQSLIKIMELVQ